MATTKGPQFYLNTDDHAENEIIEWAKNLSRGRKSAAAIEAMITGRALAQTCQPIADLMVAAARRGEVLTLAKLEDYISMFKAHNPEVVAPVVVPVVVPVAAPVIPEPEPEPQPEPEKAPESVKKPVAKKRGPAKKPTEKKTVVKNDNDVDDQVDAFDNMGS